MSVTGHESFFARQDATCEVTWWTQTAMLLQTLPSPATSRQVPGQIFGLLPRNISFSTPSFATSQILALSALSCGPAGTQRFVICHANFVTRRTCCNSQVETLGEQSYARPPRGDTKLMAMTTVLTLSIATALRSLARLPVTRRFEIKNE